MTVQVLHGSCIDLLPTLEAESVHAVVTDPPYHLTNRTPDVKWCVECRRVLGGRDGKPDACPACGGALEWQRSQGGRGFMGKAWDGGDVAFRPETWAAVLRVMKPGAYLLAFSGTRTYHRMVCAIEDAGFEIRDQIGWLYGSGFPKGTDKAKIPEAWQGFNTALKPAWEPIVLARKPMPGTLAANLERYGCGAMNIEGCRIDPANGDDFGRTPLRADGTRSASRADGYGMAEESTETPAGRWPANVVHDGSEEVLAAFPDAPGQQGDLTGHSRDRVSVRVFGDMKAARDAPARGDSGSAARFFYCAKADREDREHGLQGHPLREGGIRSETSGQHITRRDGGAPGPVANHHPTVKPTELMRWLVRLVTPPGGTVLDPFLGSGSTGRAAVLEGFDFIGMELEAEYVPIAEARIGIVDPDAFRLGAA